jgi:GWxTD domain-containing protein
MRIRHTAVVVCLMFAATTVFGALSKENTEFAKGPAQLLFTKEEKEQWKKIKTDADAKTFIELFWARRDPTPATPANEYHTMVLERASAADARFAQGRTIGSRTDRGKVFILMGSPTKIRRTGVESVSTIQTPTGQQPEPPREMWQYDQGESTLKLGQPVVEVAFMDQYQTNEWKMERVRGTDYTSVFDRVARSYITQPNLTEV